MLAHASFAIVFVLAAWWMSTGIVLKAVWLAEPRSKRVLLVSSVLGVVALLALMLLARRATLYGAYASFVSALVVWAWHELTFLGGQITGPRKLPCPEGLRGARRFWMATLVVIHHELALALTFIVIAAVTWKQPNQVGTLTFAVLWIMRLSAKLNVFLGVRNMSEAFVPKHLVYILSYFRRTKSMNALMPLSLLLGTVAAARLGIEASAADDAFLRVSLTLLSSIVALAVFEHACLVLPVSIDTVAWRWLIQQRQGASPGREDLDKKRTRDRQAPLTLRRVNLKEHPWRS